MTDTVIIIMTIMIAFNVINFYLLCVAYVTHEKRLRDIAKILLAHFKDIQELERRAINPPDEQK